MVTVSAFLTEVRSLIQKGWCQNMAAQDQYGQMINSSDPLACAWCISGAYLHVMRCHHPDVSAVGPAWSALKDQAPNGHVIHYNDNPNTTQADMLSLVDRAIADPYYAERSAV